jgi:hypothetical protein
MGSILVPSVCTRTSNMTESELHQLSSWVYDLCPWSVFFTGTFKGEFSEGSASKAFERYMKRDLYGVSYFYSVERNPSRYGHHVHALFGHCPALQRSHAWRKWFTRYGRARVEPVRSREDVADYCSKHLAGYLTKEGGWWNQKVYSPDLWAPLSSKS